MKMITTETWSTAFEELKEKSGRVFFEIPDESEFIGISDLVILEKWTASDLLKLARRNCFQVAVIHQGVFSKDLLPFVDWIFETMPLKDELRDFLNPKKEERVLRKSLKKALFLDRDGVVNLDHGYVGDPKKVELMPHITELIAKANHHKIPVIVVTNQSGIGRGFYSQKDFQEVMACISRLLAEDQAHIDHIENAPYHPSSLVREFKMGRQFRKPRPGMIHHGANQKDIKLSDSILVGDRGNDLRAGVLAGVGEICLLDSDQGSQEMLDFHSWISHLKYEHGLMQILDGIHVRTIANFNELRI